MLVRTCILENSQTTCYTTGEFRLQRITESIVVSKTDRKTIAGDKFRPGESTNRAAATAGWILALLAAIFALNFGRQLSGDAYWHLKAGQWMVENRAFPFEDPFSYTATHGWILQEWGFQVIAWLVSRISFDLLAWLCFAMVAGALLLTFKTARRHASVAAAFAVVVLASGVSADMVDVRAQVAGLLAFAVLVWTVDRKAEEGLPIWLPVLFLVWANFHSSFTAGLILLSVETAMMFWTALKSDEPGRFSGAIRNAKVTIASVLIATANPNGYHIYEFPLRTIGHGGMTSIIAEWTSPDFRSLSGAFFGVVILALMWGLSRREKPLSGPAIARILVFLTAGLMARRLAPFFVLACAPAIASILTPTMDDLLRRRRVAWALVVLLSGMIIWGVWFRISDMGERSAFDYVTMTEVFPEKACDYILEQNPPGPMFNEMNYGSYLIWRLWPEYKVFVDNRNDIFYDGAFEDFMSAAMAGGGSAWRRVFDDRGINLVILMPNSLLADILSEVPEWRLLYSDDKAVVFSRRSVPSTR